MWQYSKGIFQSFRISAPIPGNEFAADLRCDITSLTPSTAESMICPYSMDETSKATAFHLKRRLTEWLLNQRYQLLLKDFARRALKTGYTQLADNGGQVRL